MASRRAVDRAFVYRGGVRVAGTVLSCDSAAGGELVFLSHAPTPGAKGRRALPRVGSGRRRLLATEATLKLLGLDPSNTHALVAVPGRPFSLGGLRLEVFPSGLMPGAVSLLCERAGQRIVYAGPVGLGTGAELRAADAVCVDAGAARTGVDFPGLEPGLQSVGRAVREVLAAGVGTGGPAALGGAGPDGRRVAGRRSHRRFGRTAPSFWRRPLTRALACQLRPCRASRAGWVQGKCCSGRRTRRFHRGGRAGGASHW